MYPKKSLLLTLAGLTYALLTHCWRQIKICTFSVDVSYMMYKTRTKTRKCIDVDICQCNIHVYITSDTSFGLIRLSDGRLFIYMQAVVGVSSGCSETEKIIHVFIWICVYVQVSKTTQSSIIELDYRGNIKSLQAQWNCLVHL